jgi:hypothetical protein
MTNTMRPLEEIQRMIDDLREQGYYCFISNIAHSFDGGTATNVTPNGEFAVSFVRLGEVEHKPTAIHANLRHAILKAIEKKRYEIYTAKNLPNNQKVS